MSSQTRGPFCRTTAPAALICAPAAVPIASSVLACWRGELSACCGNLATVGRGERGEARRKQAMAEQSHDSVLRAEIAAALRRWSLVANGAPHGAPRRTTSGCVVLVRRGAERLGLKIVAPASDEMQALP